MEAVQFLVQVGCSVLAIDDRGQTAVDAVKVRGTSLCECRVSICLLIIF